MMSNIDGEAVIMLAFQASGTGSTPVQCIECFSTIFLLYLFTKKKKAEPSIGRYQQVSS
jgi:hypothetical protein